jgi:hypothetical protein
MKKELTYRERQSKAAKARWSNVSKKDRIKAMKLARRGKSYST